MRQALVLLALSASLAAPCAAAQTATAATRADPHRGAIARAMADLTGALREASLQAKSAREAQARAATATPAPASAIDARGASATASSAADADAQLAVQSTP